MGENVVDKILLEWSYKTEKGYPDITSEKDLEILENLFGITLSKQEKQKLKEEQEEQEEQGPSPEELKALIDRNKDNKKLLSRIHRTLKSSSGVDELKAKLKEIGIDKDTFSDRNLPRDIISILIRGKKPHIEEFITLLDRNSLPERGNVYKNTGKVPVEKIQEIGRISGAKNTVGMGKGEILLSLMFKNVTLNTESKGDLLVDERSAELKSNQARLSGKQVNVKYPTYNKVSETGWQSRFTEDIKISKEEGTIPELLNHTNKALKQIYPKTRIEIKEEDLVNMRNVVAKVAIDSYIVEKEIETFILFNNKTGYLRQFNPATKIYDAIDRGEVEFNTKTHPQLSGFK